MKPYSKFLFVPVAAAAVSLALLSTGVFAADSQKDNPTKEFMKKYHKAPQGTDPVSKRAVQGKATPAELKELAAGYHAMAKAKPPVGDEADWKQRTEKIANAADAMVKGEPGAAERYKEANNCKGCHDLHKPKNEGGH